MNNTAITNNVLVKKSKMKKDKVIFLITAMTLPLIQFFIMYIMVNFNSILLSFKTYNGDGTFTFSGFNQFGQVIKDFANESFMSKMLTNSLIMYLVTSPLTLVSCMFLAYTIWKKVLFNKFFSVIFCSKDSKTCPAHSPISNLDFLASEIASADSKREISSILRTKRLSLLVSSETICI